MRQQRDGARAHDRPHRRGPFVGRGRRAIAGQVDERFGGVRILFPPALENLAEVWFLLAFRAVPLANFGKLPFDVFRRLGVATLAGIGRTEL